MNNLEQTLSIIKPDAVERNLSEEIKNEFKKNGFNILKEKKIKLEKSEAEKFYQVHQSKPFYNNLCDYLSSGPIIVMLLGKENAVTENRKLMGATDPKYAETGTLREKYGISIDSTDLPVSSIYIDYLKSEGFIVENKSRWLIFHTLPHFYK